MKVIPIGTPNLLDVPASLRRLAEMLESGDEPGAMHAIVVAVDGSGEIRVYGYGKVGTRAHEVGTLQMAVFQKLLHKIGQQLGMKI